MLWWLIHTLSRSDSTYKVNTHTTSSISFFMTYLFQLPPFTMSSIHIHSQATMYNGPTEKMVGVTAQQFHDSNEKEKKTYAEKILNTPVKVKMYIKNQQTPFPTFIIKEADLLS